MGAQPVTTYEGIMPYFEYMKREFYVNADPGISLTQFFLRNQPAELRTTFYSMYEGNLEDITEEEIESFCMKFERKANKTEINKLMDILDLKRGISESPMGYLARLKLMVVRISNIHDMLPEDAFILAKLLNEIPKPICADLADEYQLNPTIVCEMWETYLKRMTINNHFLKQSNPGYNVNGTTRGNGGMNRVTNSRFTSNNTTRYNAVDSYNDKRSGIDGRAFNNHDDKLYRGNQNQRRDDYVTNIVNMYNERKHDSMNDTKKNDERYSRSAEVFQPNAREPVVNNQENRQGGKTIFCYVCGDPNHYASRCPNRKQEQIISKIINQKILKIPNTYQQSPTIRTVLMISNNALSVMVDGGAESPMLPISWLENLESYEYEIQSSNHMVKLADETIIPCLGYVKLKVLCLETMKRCELNFILLQEGEPTITNMNARQLHININEKVDEIMGERQENLKMLNYLEECAPSLHRVIIENEDIFNEVQVEPAVEIEIPLKEGFEPIIQQPYKLNQSQLEVLGKELNKQILLGHTYSVKNPIHCSPITITSDNRVCVDSRKQNVMMIETELELSSIRDIQLLLKSSSSNSNVISQIDLASAFKLFKVKDSQRILANTVCPLGCFGSSRLQFGWTSSSYIFHTTLNRHMKLWNIDKFIQYIDDIIFYGNKQEQEKNLIMFMKMAYHLRLKLNLKKSKFFIEKTEFLGFSLSMESISIAQDKVDEFEKLERPATRVQMQRVLGKLNFVARHIPKFSMIVKNLYPKSENYDWNDVKEAAWCKLIEAMKVYHEFKIPSIDEMLYCTHSHEDNCIRIETFFYVDNIIKDENKRLFDIYMRQLKGPEISYNLIEKELLSLSEYLSKWKDYARMPCVITYNKVIQSILTSDACLEYSNRIQRFAAPIIYSNAKITHITGVKLKMVKITQHPEGKMNILLDMQEVKNFQNCDPVCQSINKYIEDPTDSNFSRLPKFLADRIGLVTMIMNCLAIDQRIIVSEETAKKAATAHHAAFHPGRTKLYKYLSERIYCIGLSTICTRVCNNCLQCVEYKRLPPAKCTKWVIPSCARTRGHCDFMFINSATIFNLVDAKTGFIHSFLMKTRKTADVIGCLESVFKDCPYQFIVVDNAPELVSNEMVEYLMSHNCLLITSPRYHSQSNGKVERANQTLRRLIEKFLDQNYSMCESIKKATTAMNIDKIRQYYCGEEDETSFVPNVYKKVPVPHYIYFKRKGKLDRKFTLGLCIAEVGNRIYHIETDEDSFFVSKDFCHTGIPSSQQIEDIGNYDSNEYKLDDTFFINGKWDNKSMLVNFSDPKNVHDEDGAHFDLAENTLMWDNDELTLQMNSKNNKSSCDESNVNFNTDSNENAEIHENLSNEIESENFNNVIDDDNFLNDLKIGESDKAPNNIIAEEITENHGDINEILDGKTIEETDNVDMENLQNQTLVSNEDIFAFLDQHNDKTVYFVDGSATNDPSSKHINVPGVGILEVFNDKKQINYYSETSFLKGRLSSPRYEVGGILLCLILGEHGRKNAIICSDNTYALSFSESEKLKQLVQNKKQPQNDLWNVISTMMNMAKTGGFKYEGRHFASKQSTFNKIVDTLAKGNVESAEKLMKILIDKGYKMNKKEMPKNWKTYLPM